MKDQLFIPNRIKVGWQERSDTYTKRLAYVIYYDAKGKLRKETSWKSWCDEKLGSEEFDNVPHSGFILNKDVKRSTEWGADGRNLIRIYDDRGMEFEISCANLMFSLMTYDCVKRSFEGEFVYAWYGQELILLPVDCDEYRKSKGYSELQNKKVSAKSLIVGATYETKTQEKLVYLGKFFTYDWKWVRKERFKDIQNEYSSDWRNIDDHVRVAKKKFVFQRLEDGKKGWRSLKKYALEYHASPAKFARVIDETPVDDLADRLESLKSEFTLNKIVGLKFEPIVLDPEKWEKVPYGYSQAYYPNKWNDRRVNYALKIGEDEYRMHRLNESVGSRPMSQDRADPNYGKYESYSQGWIDTECNRHVFKDGEILDSPNAYQYKHSYYHRHPEPVRLTDGMVREIKNAGKLYYVLESGVEIPVP